MYVIHFLIVAAIFAGALPVLAADRAGAVVFLHGSQGGRCCIRSYNDCLWWIARRYNFGWCWCGI